MRVTVRSFAKINVGLHIGPLRSDGYHELRTVYQTIGWHDIIGVRLARGTGIEIRCEDPRVPTDESNTCYRLVARALALLKTRGRVIIDIEKRLPVQGGLGGASANAVAALLALERVAKKQLSPPERLRIASEVGCDLPLFLIGGTVLGAGRGEEVYPLPDLPAAVCVIAMSRIAVSTPKAFADWDLLGSGEAMAQPPDSGKLTPPPASDRMLMFGRTVSAWLSGQSQGSKFSKTASGVPVSKGRGRAETPLLDLVRTGIENDFERVVFPQYPELRGVKRVLERGGALYASLSGSGSSVYGLFGSRTKAESAVTKLRNGGISAVITGTLTRQQYWKKFLVSSF